MFDQRYKVPGRVMVSDTPFTHLQTFPIVNDGTTDMPIDLRKFVSVSGAECRWVSICLYQIIKLSMSEDCCVEVYAVFKVTLVVLVDKSAS